jgi:hypothetical protein
MGAFTMECIDFFFAPQQPRAAPVSDDVGGLSHTDRQGHKDGADGHGKDDKRNWTQIELDGGTGPNRDSPGI